MSRIALTERARRRFGGSETAPPPEPVSLALKFMNIKNTLRFCPRRPSLSQSAPKSYFGTPYGYPSIAKELVHFLRSFEALVGYAS